MPYLKFCLDNFSFTLLTFTITYLLKKKQKIRPLMDDISEKFFWYKF